MTLRFRQTFTLFPGVRINVGKRGISTSFGGPGASVNVGRKGITANVGVPGTGLSYRTTVLPFGQGGTSEHGESKPGDAEPRNIPGTAPVYMPQDGMNEISSASVEVLTSASLLPLRDLIAKAREQEAQVKSDLKEAREEAAQQKAELARRQRSLFRWFYKRRIAELEELIPVTESEVDRLESWEETTKVDVTFEAGDAAQRAYAQMVRAFDTLKRCSKKWDVTADRATDQFAERSLATRTVNRYPVTFDFSASDLIKFEGRAMRFENVNGDDILIYPGVAVMPRADGAFALIDLRELEISAEARGFHEEEGVPPDSEVIGQTWFKTNKDGSPDRRFKDNYQIPICAYGNISFRSKTGVTEEYMVSNADSALAFANAVKAYQRALSESG